MYDADTDRVRHENKKMQLHTMSALLSTHHHSAIWTQYKVANRCTPQNVSQLMKWSKETDNIQSLQFCEAKQIFAQQSQQDNISNNMFQEKQELKEWIADCKEEILCIRSKQLQNEDDFEESMEEIEIKIGHLLQKLNDAKQAIIKRRKEKYEKVQNNIKSQTTLIQATLNILSKVTMRIHITHIVFPHLHHFPFPIP